MKVSYEGNRLDLRHITLNFDKDRGQLNILSTNCKRNVVREYIN